MFEGATDARSTPAAWVAPIAAVAPGPAVAECDDGSGLDCNGNAIVDSCDIAFFSSADCNSNGVPDECDLGVPQELAKLTAADAAAGDQFGWSVAVAGDTAVVGAQLDDGGALNSGSAYVFRNSGGPGAPDWQEIAKLTAADAAAASDSFGYSVAVSGNTAVIGAYLRSSSRGAAYVFSETGGVWQQVTRLSGSSTGDQLGCAVAISGETLVVGACGDDDAGLASGSAFVYRKVNGVWQYQVKLTADDAAAGDQFGSSVAIAGDRVVIGAPFADDPFVDSGVSYVFREIGGEWQQVARLVAPHAKQGDSHGYTVAASGDTVLTGAYSADVGSSTYVYREVGGEWRRLSDLQAIGGPTPIWSSAAVALDGDLVVVGSPSDDDSVTNSGAAFVFDLRSAAHDCNGNRTPDDCEISSGVATDCNADGIIDACLAPGDLNGDGHADVADQAAFTDCLAGVDQLLAPACCLADLDGDGDADLADFAEIQRALGGQ